MKTPRAFRSSLRPPFASARLLVGLTMVVAAPLCAHDLSGDPAHPHYDWSVRPPEAVWPLWLVARANPGLASADQSSRPARPNPPLQAAAFAAFAPRVNLGWDEHFLYIESNGLPAHGMMEGITAWQQQVPLPQPYFGNNAWRIPLQPSPAPQPQTIRDHFLRGAIAIAANGIPIFNPQNNRGELSAEIGELDQWGGHCGRADDYHYHVAPLHLQSVVGPGLPIAFALDGYPIYGLTEPDGSAPTGLDAFDGHTTPALGYHYHASKHYPYVNGGFHGSVVERDGQVDPQPRAQPIRPALPPLRGAKITGFVAGPDEKSFELHYVVNGKRAAVTYSAASGGRWTFHFVNADETTNDETYGTTGRPSGSRSGGENPPPTSPGPREVRPPDDARKPAPAPTSSLVPPRSGTFFLRSPAVIEGGPLPVEFTGDGASSTLPLDWSGAPEGTKSFAVIMHHIDPEGVTKWYWTLYNIPADVHALPKKVRGIGTLGNNSINQRLGYAPPHSKGPGPKTYILTVYALMSPLQISSPPAGVDRALLLSAMQDRILDTAELRVVYSSSGDVRGPSDDSPPTPPDRRGDSGRRP